MRLLAIETAYDVCGAALVSERALEALEEGTSPRRHNEVLAPAVGRLLAQAGLGFADLDAIALSVGPGSYTGLRVGMSYVKGLAFGAGLQVIPVPTLPSMLEGEDLKPPHWVAAWSHGRNVYVLHREDEDTWGEVQFMAWEDFISHSRGQTVAGHQLDRFLPCADISVVPTCPSAAKVGKFAFRKQLPAAPDLAALVPDYHHEYQQRLAGHAHS